MNSQNSDPFQSIYWKRLEQDAWLAGRLRYKLWPQQKPIYDAVRKLSPSVAEAVFLCARQFGKSYLGVVLAIEDCLKYPDTCTLIMGPDIKQTVGIVAPRLRHIAADAPPGLVQQQKSESKWIIGTSELVIGGMDISSSSQRGKTLQNVYIEEIVDSDPDKYVEALRSDVGPALTHSKGGRIVYMTTLPKVPDHPFITETMPTAAMNNALFSYTIYDNKQITQEQFDRCVKLAGGLDSVDFRREYLNQVVRDGTRVLVPEFDEGKHVKSCAEPEHTTYWVGGDTGGTRDRHVFHLCTYDFTRAKTLILDERSFDIDTPTVAILPALREMEGERKISARYIDCAGQLQVDLMAAGYPCQLPRKDELDATVNQVRKAAAQNEFEIDPKCRLLITTLRSGTFNRLRTDLERTRALGHCDAFMSLAYALRHRILSNPYPLLGDARPHTHYIALDERPQSKSAEALKSIFAVRR